MQRRRILVADDSGVARLMATMILSRENFEVLTANDGREAVERARAELPDLVVLDVVMPNMDGFEACRELKKEAATAAIPVILATSRGEPHNVEAGWVAGCSDYVTKPIDGLELVSKVRSLLGEDREVP